ncbi:MAG: hypothetical protein IJU84_00875 [Clostridia bacterium]|nr:hypothetical protein [Clostridia bacterium]
MKKVISAILMCTLSVASAFALASCRNTDESPEDDGIGYRTEEKVNFMESVYLTDYVDALDEEQTVKFAAEGSRRQTSAERGIAISSYYSTKIDGEPAYTYMITTAEELTHPHSVVFLDVSADRFEGGKAIRVEVIPDFSVTQALILPENLNVTPEVADNKIIFSVGGYGSYTVVPNDYTDPDKVLTVFVREPEKAEIPYGYTLIEYKPGLHFVEDITLRSNTVLYLHAGAFLVARPGADGSAFIYANSVENVKILGHGVIDLSQLPWRSKVGIGIVNGKNIEVNGVTLINSATWTMQFTYCDRLTVKDCIIFGYRQNSDAYAICSSTNVRVTDCFARSGDDLFEVKTYRNAVSENIVFENCVAWPDNCRGFGIIQETYSAINNVTYKNCTLLYQLKDWAEHMAAFVITAGEAGDVSNVSFEDCDLFYCKVFAIRMSVGENDETSGIKGFDNKITGVTFKNCNFRHPSSGRGIIKFRNNTTDAQGIGGIVFDNVTFRGEKLVNLDDIRPVYEGDAPADITVR